VIKFSPDSQTVAVSKGPSNNINLLDTKNWCELCSATSGGVNLSFSSDSKLMMTYKRWKARGEFPSIAVSIFSTKGPQQARRGFTGPCATMGAGGHVLVQQYSDDQPNCTKLYSPNFDSVLAEIESSGYFEFHPHGLIFHTQKGLRRTQVWRMTLAARKPDAHKKE
jgi:hypothetical protein